MPKSDIQVETIMRYANRYALILIPHEAYYIVDITTKRNSEPFYSYSSARKAWREFLAHIEHKQEIV